jgi:peptide/nickel transport system permease protein
MMALSLLKNLARSIGVIILVTFVTFSLMYSDPAGIARGTLGLQASPEDVDRRMEQLGLDRPLLVQYWDWITGVVTGDLGRSFYTSESVVGALSTRVPVTLTLVVATLLLTAVVSVTLGVAAAVRGGLADKVVQVTSVLGSAIPPYVIAIVLVFALAVNYRIFPATGYVPPSAGLSPWLLSIFLPVMALSVGAVAGSAAQFRTAVLDQLGRDYTRTLRARGVAEREIIFRNVLRNAAPPGLTALSLTLIALLGGTVFIEQVFAIPGLGRLTTTSAQISDMPMVMGAVLVTVVIVLIVNFLGDLGITLLNPKARKR